MRVEMQRNYTVIDIAALADCQPARSLDRRDGVAL
jgi:hypothetical protein